MRENKENYMICCNCGYAVKMSKIFIKKYQNTATTEIHKHIIEYEV